MEKKKCSIIYNPVSSDFHIKELEKVCDVLNQEYKVCAIPSEYSGHVIYLTKKLNNDADLLISYGGDGTFGEVVKGIYDETQNALISHIPVGTANDLRKNFGLSKNPVVSAERIASGVEKKLDIYTINDIPFSYVAAFGYFANVPCDTSADLKRRLKYLAYLLVGLQEYKNKKPKTYDMIVESETKVFREQAIVSTFTNSKGFGGMSLFPDASLDDGKIEVSFIRNMTKVDMLKMAKDIVSGKFDLHNYPDVINHFCAEFLNITFTEDVPLDPIDLDGDPCDVLNERNHSMYKIRRGKVLKMQLPK